MLSATEDTVVCPLVPDYVFTSLWIWLQAVLSDCVHYSFWVPTHTSASVTVQSGIQSTCVLTWWPGHKKNIKNCNGSQHVKNINLFKEGHAVTHAFRHGVFTLETWIQSQVTFCEMWWRKWYWSWLLSHFIFVPQLITIPPLLCTHHEFGAFSLTWHLSGCSIRKLVFPLQELL